MLVMGSNMAECHPVGFQWVMEARQRGATVIHVDPKFSRTSANATFQLVTGDHRVHHCLYRRPGGKDWELIPLEKAMDLVAERVRDTRDRTWEQKDHKRKDVQRTLGIAHLGGATLDDEENYLLKKLYTALGIVQVENQARI